MIISLASFPLFTFSLLFFLCSLIPFSSYFLLSQFLLRRRCTHHIIIIYSRSWKIKRTTERENKSLHEEEKNTEYLVWSQKLLRLFLYCSISMIGQVQRGQRRRRKDTDQKYRLWGKAWATPTRIRWVGSNWCLGGRSVKVRTVLACPCTLVRLLTVCCASLFILGLVLYSSLFLCSFCILRLTPYCVCPCSFYAPCHVLVYLLSSVLVSSAFRHVIRNK